MNKVSSEIRAEWKQHFNALPTNQKFAALADIIRFMGSGMEMSAQGFAAEVERYATLDFEQSIERLVTDAKWYGPDEIATGLVCLVDKHNQENKARAVADVSRALGIVYGGAV